MNILDQQLYEDCKRGDFSQVKELIEKGANVNVVDGAGSGTPLHWAVAWGNQEFIEFFVEKGADVNAKNKRGKTPLLVAVLAFTTQTGSIAAMQYLLDKGANIEGKDDWGATPLISAVDKGLLSVAKLLIERGANVNVKDHEGKTPLHYVSLGGGVYGFPEDKTVDMVKLLIDNGADTAVIDSLGHTPVLEAIEGFEFAASSLKNLYNTEDGLYTQGLATDRIHKSKVLAEFCRELSQGLDNYDEARVLAKFLLGFEKNPDHYYEKFPELLEQETSKKVRDFFSKVFGNDAPLLMAACMGQTQRVQLFLDSSTDEGKEYALGLSAMLGHTQTVKFLAEYAPPEVLRNLPKDYTELEVPVLAVLRDSSSKRKGSGVKPPVQEEAAVGLSM